jgi:Na+-driven multidrug efflux pump
MRDVLTLSLFTMVAFTVAAWIILALAAGMLANAFNAGEEARDLIVFFCRWLSPLFVFMGALFIANAAFNTLGRAQYSTFLNWGRATLGTIPFVLAGGALAGAYGVLAGHMMGGIIFGVIGVIRGYQLIARIGKSVSST